MYINSSEFWSFNTGDIVRASSCLHCSMLAIARSLRVESVLDKLAPFLDQSENDTLAQKYGLLFEQLLFEEIFDSTTVGTFASPEIEGDFEQTIKLMQAGVPIIYQGGLERVCGQSIFKGRPDFLVREDWDLIFEDSKLKARQVAEHDTNAPARYVAFDAKYGGNAKPAHLMQLGLYVDALDELGFKSVLKRHGLILGSRRVETFEEIEIGPATKLARKKLLLLIDLAEDAKRRKDYGSFEASALQWHCPSKQNCEICEYPELCQLDRRLKDDLVRVANVTQNQISRLAASGISTMTALASASDDLRPLKMTIDTFNKIRRQARVQIESERSGKPVHEMLPDPAIQYLPPKSDLDVFFDFEGFPYFVEGGGLEYLFGNYVWGDGDNEGEARYDLFTEFWAHDRKQEKEAFSKFVTWAVDRMKKDPNAHIYHYASYEVSALKRLANRHGCFEQEVAWLIQNGKLVDMYEIVKSSIVIGEESYSIKKLERHYGFVRDGDVQKGDASIEQYDNWRELTQLRNNPNLPKDSLEEIAREADRIFESLRYYNLQDVWSTRELYRWLSSLDGASSKYGQLEKSEEERSTKTLEDLALLQEQTKELFEQVEGHNWGVDEKSDFRAQVWLALTHSILFYKREDVMFWADLAMRVALDEELLEFDRGAGVIRDVREIERKVKEKRDGTKYLLVTYQAQLDPDDLFSPKLGQEIVARYVGERNRKYRDWGKVIEVAAQIVTFNRQTTEENVQYLPNALIDATHIPTTSKQQALLRLCSEIAASWGSPKNEAPINPAVMDLLMRRASRFRSLDKVPLADSADYLPAVKTAVKDLHNSVLAIQGPPGSGKTFLASRTIAELVQSGKRIGVTANSHAAIENLLYGCIDAGVPAIQIVKVQREAEQERPWQVKKSNGPVATFMKKSDGGFVVGGTSFFFCNKEISPYKFDYLFIDEAAQFSLVDAMAVSAVADNIVLMGDPLQLPQVVLAIHPGGVENSALGHYMGQNTILPKDKGYFLEVTRRLHPAINHAVSWLAYEGKLQSHESTIKFEVEGHRPGLVAVPVEHQGNSTSSQEESLEVLRLVKQLYREGDPESVLVVAAYNAQVDLIRVTLDSHGYTEDKVLVGTVDKFQGREAMAVVFSFAASSSQDAPRGLEFLLDRNRLNVAISRAKATCYLVYGTNLLDSQFRTVAEVKAVSRLAGLLEFSNPGK